MTDTNKRIDNLLENFDKGYVSYKEAKAEILQLIRDEALKTQFNSVAWVIGVIDELHMESSNDGSYKEDSTYKGIKNNIRDKFKQKTGFDPAPDYPINAELISTELKES